MQYCLRGAMPHAVARGDDLPGTPAETGLAVDAEEVERMLLNQAKTEADFADVERVMVQSLRLTGKMLEEILPTAAATKAGAAKRSKIPRPRAKRR